MKCFLGGPQIRDFEIDMTVGVEIELPDIHIIHHVAPVWRTGAARWRVPFDRTMAMLAEWSRSRQYDVSPPLGPLGTTYTVRWKG